MTSLIFVSSSNYSIECPFCQFQALFSNNTSSLLLFHTSQLSWFYLLPLHFAECYFCQSHKWPSLLITVINCELHALIATGIHLWRSDALAHCFLVLVTFLLWGQHIQLSDLKGTEVYFGSKFQRPQSRHGQLAPKEKRHSERNWTMKAAHIMAEGAQRENRGAQAGRATPQWTTSSNKRTLKTPVTFWKSHSEHMKLWGEHYRSKPYHSSFAISGLPIYWYCSLCAIHILCFSQRDSVPPFGLKTTQYAGYFPFIHSSLFIHSDFLYCVDFHWLYGAGTVDIQLLALTPNLEDSRLLT